MSLPSFSSLGGLTTSFCSKAQMHGGQRLSNLAGTLLPGVHPSPKILIQLLGGEMLIVPGLLYVSGYHFPIIKLPGYSNLYPGLRIANIEFFTIFHGLGQ